MLVTSHSASTDATNPTQESEIDREQSGDMQLVSAIASSSRDYIDTASPIAESDETHAQAVIVHGGDSYW